MPSSKVLIMDPLMLKPQVLGCCTIGCVHITISGSFAIVVISVMRQVQTPWSQHAGAWMTASQRALNMLVLSACREMVACAKSHPAMGEAFGFSEETRWLFVLFLCVKWKYAACQWTFFLTDAFKHSHSVLSMTCAWTLTELPFFISDILMDG